MLDDGYFTIQLLWLESLSSEVVLGFLFVQQLIVETQTLLERKLFIIMLINVPSLNLLTPSFARCIVDVRVLSIWKFDTSDESSEQFGLNMKLLHEKVSLARGALYFPVYMNYSNYIKNRLRYSFCTGNVN